MLNFVSILSVEYVDLQSSLWIYIVILFNKIKKEMSRLHQLSLLIVNSTDSFNSVLSQVCLFYQFKQTYLFSLLKEKKILAKRTTLAFSSKWTTFGS